MTDLIYDPALVDTVATTLDLRAPNRNALDTLAQALDGAEHGKLLVADLATGVGKTYIAAGLLDYLYGQGVRNVVIVTPGSTIQRKTVANFTAGAPKYVRGLQCSPKIITLDNFEKGSVASAMSDPNEMKVFVFTVQSLLKPDTKENRRAHRDHETIGQSLSDYLRASDDLVVIADEHHIYAGNAKKFGAAIDDLDPMALIGLTATPDPSTPAEAIVYRYPLAEAIADGYVKIPVLVGRLPHTARRRCCPARCQGRSSERLVRTDQPQDGHSCAVRCRADHRRGQRHPRHARRLGLVGQHRQGPSDHIEGT